MLIEDNKLVYDIEKVTNEEKEIFEEMGIQPKSKFYLIMNEATKVKYEEIEEKGTLAEFRDLVNSGEFEQEYESAYVVEDIDLGARENNGTWEGENWTPIGTNSIPFKGTFDGNGNKIKGLYINKEEDDQALFRYNKGTIRNVGIEGSYIKANAKVAGLVIMNYGNVKNCYNNATITGASKVAGVIYYNLGNVENCYNQGSINRTSDSWDYAGIVIYNEGTVSYCYNKGKVNGNYNTGAIVAVNKNTGTITNCYNIANIDANEHGYNKGGIVGDNWGSISYCYNLGNVSSINSSVGGIAGHNESGATIIQCYNNGDVNSSGFCIGGIVGKNNGNIQYCYNTGYITKSQRSADDMIGGIVGNNSGTVTYCYNIGKVESHIKKYYGAIVGILEEGSAIESCYYLEGIQEDTNGIEKTEEEMKLEDFIQLLNATEVKFEMDTTNKNKGFPVLIFE